VEVLTRHLTAPLPDPRAHGVSLPEGLWPVLTKACAKDPADRYRHAAEMAEDLEAIRDTGGGGLRRPGSTVGEYRITGVLGRGGMGAVYSATDRRDGAEVALKLLPSELTNQGAEHVQRFLREGRAAAGVRHPNVVGVHEVGRDGDAYFIAMELVRGGSAGDRLKHHPDGLAAPEATRILIGAARGLGAVHAAGMVHRDIKPANVMLGDGGSVKLTDFGLARARETGHTVTKTGQMMGTPAYMAPEQVQNGPVDARTDLYSLGASYFALLTGVDPYRSENPAAMFFVHVHKPTPDPRSIRPDIPDDCCAIVFRAMAKDPAARFGSAASTARCGATTGTASTARRTGRSWTWT
jgi:serine/threonine protein kinase